MMSDEKPFGVAIEEALDLEVVEASFIERDSKFGESEDICGALAEGRSYYQSTKIMVSDDAKRLSRCQRAEAFHQILNG